MKKIITLSIIIFLMIGMFAVNVQANSAGISVSSKTVDVGETINVAVNFGDKISTAQFKLTYDETKFEYISKTGPGSYNPGSKTYGFFTSDGSDPTYDNVVFTFKAKATGNVEFGLNSLKISTASEKNFAPNVSASSATVTINKIEEPEQQPEQKPEEKPNTNTDTKPSTNTNTNANTKPSTNTNTNANANTKPSTNTNTNTNTNPNTNPNIQTEEETADNNETTNVKNEQENEINNETNTNTEIENEIEEQNQIVEEGKNISWKSIICSISLIVIIIFIIVMRKTK